MILLSVFVGAALGAMLRYVIIMIWPVQSSYFTAILIINSVGALGMGIVFASGQLSALNGFWSVGLLGGFTTFSTMMVQSAQLPFNKQLSYLMIQLIGGMLCFYMGVIIVNIFGTMN